MSIATRIIGVIGQPLDVGNWSECPISVVANDDGEFLKEIGAEALEKVKSGY
jgi:hypothetical protein